MKLQTLFSDENFIKVVAKSGAADFALVSLPYYAAGKLGAIHAVMRPGRWGSRVIELGPFGLYGCPSLENETEVDDAIGQIIRLSRHLRTERFIWNVRFDHQAVADGLARHRIPGTSVYTHVLRLGPDYESTFARYSKTIRNQVRRTRQEGLVVRQTVDEKCLRAYATIYRNLCQGKGRDADIYPVSFLLELLALREHCLFLVVEIGGVIAAGGLFFRDGDSMFIWHSAADRAYSDHYPMRALYDHAIQIACDEKMATVNFGASRGVAGLEEFKASWGAQPEKCSRFEWTNPLWRLIRKIRRARQRPWLKTPSAP